MCTEYDHWYDPGVEPSIVYRKRITLAKNIFVNLKKNPSFLNDLVVIVCTCFVVFCM